MALALNGIVLAGQKGGEFEALDVMQLLEPIMAQEGCSAIRPERTLAALDSFQHVLVHVRGSVGLVSGTEGHLTVRTASTGATTRKLSSTSLGRRGNAEVEGIVTSVGRRRQHRTLALAFCARKRSGAGAVGWHPCREACAADSQKRCRCHLRGSVGAAHRSESHCGIVLLRRPHRSALRRRSIA